MTSHQKKTLKVHNRFEALAEKGKEVEEPGAVIRLLFGYSVQSAVRVYLDGQLEIERTYR